MGVQTLPRLDMSTTETDCCPKFDPAAWDKKTFTFDKKKFVRTTNPQLWHMPLGLRGMMNDTFRAIEDAGASTDDFVLLSGETSKWKGEHYFAVSKEVPGLENVEMSGDFETRVFEGPYREIPKWIEQLKAYVSARGKKMQEMYFYYTTCPSCARKYGKNYVVGFAKV